MRHTVFAALLVVSTLWRPELSAAEQVTPNPALEKQIPGLVPSLENYIASGMKAFDNPGLAVGIVMGDRLVYAKGYGVKRKGGEPVDIATVFQIGSTTKAFLATTMAIAADRKKFAWDDRVVDLDPNFQLKDPWVTGEFRVLDLLAQRAGMPPYVNDILGVLGADDRAMVHSLRYVEPVSSFRSTFAYTNITHIEAERIVAQQLGAPDWDTVVRTEIFEPLGMRHSSLTAEAIESAPNRASGYRWSTDGTVEVPITPIFPYGFGGAGAINSTIEDLARWVRLHLARGEFEGKRIVSAENLAVTRIPRIGLSDKMAYAMGWLLQSTPNGQIVWHAGGTMGYGAYIGMVSEKDIGVIVLANEINLGLPDAIGEWILDRLMGNPDIDHVAARLAVARALEEERKAMFARPANPRPAPPLGPLVGTFVHPAFGRTIVMEASGALTVAFAETGSMLKLEPWNGDVFTASLVPEGRMAAVAANLGPGPLGFAQFQIDQKGKLNLLRLTIADYRVANQEYLFQRD